MILLRSNKASKLKISNQVPNLDNFKDFSRLSSLMKIMRASNFRNLQKRQIVNYSGSALIAFLFALLVTTSPEIAFPFAIIGLVLPYLYSSRMQEKRKRELQTLWPEILDLIISGLESGTSLPQSLAALGRRGPVYVRGYFKQFELDMQSGLPFSNALTNIKFAFQHPTADQICEVLALSQSAGSRNTSLTLRTLSDFVISDLALRGEIEAKQSWIKNSAYLAASAPWILLLILSTQSKSVSAYSSTGGVLILAIGAVMTFIAFIWMRIVSKMPEQPRIFLR